MLNADDVAQMKADNLVLRDDNAVSVVIRRGTTTLAAQIVRLVPYRLGGRTRSPIAEEASGTIIMIGDVNLDVQFEDRFTANGVLYRVIYIEPNRLGGTSVHAEAIE